MSLQNVGAQNLLFNGSVILCRHSWTWELHNNTGHWQDTEHTSTSSRLPTLSNVNAPRKCLATTFTSNLHSNTNCWYYCTLTLEFYFYYACLLISCWMMGTFEHLRCFCSNNFNVFTRRPKLENDSSKVYTRWDGRTNEWKYGKHTWM